MNTRTTTTTRVGLLLAAAALALTGCASAASPVASPTAERDGQSVVSQYIGKDGFNDWTVSDVPLPGNCLPSAQLETLRLPSHGGVSVCSHSDSLLVRGFTPTGNHSLTAIARRDAMLEQALAEGRPTHTDLGSEFLLRFASEITLDEVVEYRLFDLSGHVYDLQSDDYELYICNGVIVKNCRCRISAQVASL